MAITYVDATSGGAADPTSGDFVLPGGWQAGDVAICLWYARTDLKTFTKPAGVTQKFDFTDAVGAHLFLGYRTLQGGDVDQSWTASSQANQTTVWLCMAFRGVDGSGDPFEAGAANPVAFSTTTPNPPAVTTLTDGAVVLALLGNADAGNITQPSGYTMGAADWVTVSTGNDARAAIARKEIPSFGTEDPGVFTLVVDSNDQGSVWTGALKPAADVADLDIWPFTRRGRATSW